MVIVLPAPPACETGMGNSPPARKSAVSPESAVRLGCASVVTRPARSARSNEALMLRPSRFLTIPPMVVEPSWLATAPVPGVTIPPEPRDTPKRKPPVVSVEARLAPISLTSERLTSAMRTWRLTCNGVAVCSRERTCWPSPTKAWTRRSASAASCGAATVPVSRTKPFIGVTMMLASGMASASIWSIVSILLPTRMTAE